MHEAKAHREEMEEEFDQLTAKAEQAFTTALIIGGVLTLGYFMSKKFFSGTSKKKKVRINKKSKPIKQNDDYEEDEVEEASSNDLISRIGESLLNQATAILLELAKEKLIEFLQSQQSKTNEGNTSKSNQ